MPSTSQAQMRMMAAVAHDPAFAAKVGIPQSVGADFNTADEAAGMKRKLPARKHPKRKRGDGMKVHPRVARGA